MRRIRILWEPEVFQVIMERGPIPPESSYVEEEDET